MKKITLLITILLFGIAGMAQVTEDFEAGVPGTWTNYVEDTTTPDPGFIATTGRAHTGSGAIYHADDNIASATSAWIVTAPYTVTAATNDYLGFWYNQDYTASYYNYSGVWVSTASGDPLTNPVDFVELQEFNAAFGYSEDTWTEYNLDLTAYVGQTVYIAFKYTGDWEHRFYIDDFSMSAVPSCFAPSDLTATNATATSADLSWTENGSATAWDIEIVPAATAATGTPTATAVSNPYAATGLSASTEYDYYVRADCATDGTSNWAGPFTFATACGIINTAYTNDFTTFPGNCWEEGDNTDIATGPNGTNGAWTTDGFLNDGFTGAARINLYTTFVNDWLVSPTFDLSAGNLGLAFDVGVTTFSGTTAIAMGSDDEVQVLISNDDGATWNTLETFNAGNTPSNTGDAKLYDLSGYTSATTKFAFWASEGSVDDPEDYNFFIDNFSVDVYASLGIDDLQQIEGFVMYPNPVNDVLNISAKNTIENLQIINMLGQVVKTSSPNKNSFQLNISNLNTGIYFVKVSVNNTEATIRIVKN
jgi:hypothetical protein